jgi:SAM-dependent methyltransferase
MENKDDTTPISRDAYDLLAERYAELSGSKLENAYLDRPATLSLLPPVRGRVVLDAGCGPGAYAEWLQQEGASVIAFDVSPKMVELARRRLAPGTEVYEADLSKPLTFAGDKTVHIVLCALTMSYIKELGPVYREFNRVLKPAGHAVISIGHPWMEFKFTKNDNYFETEVLSCEWRGFGKPHVHVPFYRKSLTDVFRPLCQSGFQIEDFVEPRPVPEGKEVDPKTYEQLSRKPGFLCFRAVKTKDVSESSQIL